MEDPTLILHCGAALVTREEVFSVVTPASTETWFPTPHRNLITTVQDALIAAGYQISRERHGLTKEGARYFGVFNLENTNADNDYGWCVGLRNSHDKSFPIALCTGLSVFVCDNLSFNSDVVVKRKHTRHGERDLSQLIMGAVGKLHDKFQSNDDRIEFYRGTQIEDHDVHDLLIKAVDCRAITPQQIPKILSDWRRPPHEAFADRTVWSFQNAFTEAYKAASFDIVARRSLALHGLLDAYCGFTAKTIDVAVSVVGPDPVIVQ
jgi:uncharacterized protein DUF932